LNCDKVSKKEAEYESHTVMLTPKQWLWLEKRRREGGYRSISEALRTILDKAMKGG